jgi:glycosyltransferase involved in cell wall biosynthesis
VANRTGLTIVLLAPAASVHTARWAAALTGAGHRVVVASWRPCPGLKSSGFPDADVRIAPGAGQRPGRRATATSGWLRALIRDVRPDVVHVHSLGVHGLLALALPRGLAVVVTPWGSELRAAQRSALRAAVIWLALRRADLVLPTSAEVAAELAGKYRVRRTRIRVLSWGVPADLISELPRFSAAVIRSEFGVPANATVVLSIRSTSATYRTCEIVSGFARVAAARPDLFLVVLGGHCPDRESARRARDDYLGTVRVAAGRAAGQILIIEGALSPQRTFELMCASDIAVSVPAGDQRSSSVLEAALAGCRLVLSDIGPYRELVREGLAADMLAEPIAATLAAYLASAPAGPANCQANRKFILAHENGAAKLAELERIYRQLCRA